MSKNTVYVIGAGASYEAKLPTGNELKGKISQLLNMTFEFHKQLSGDPSICAALRMHTSQDQSGNLFNNYVKECQYISSNLPLSISIDNLIDTNRGNENLALCGKMAILRSILEAEKTSKLHFRKNAESREIRFSSLEDTWYLPFFKSLTENCNLQDLPARLRSITLIIFNYDRCIENFLLFALSSLYRISINDVAELISNLNIIHPYGTVGSLPMLNPASSTVVAFGGELDSSQLVLYSKAIRTFTEGAHSENIDKLKQSMEGADRLIFLGFAFHRLNMELLGGYQGDFKYKNKNVVRCYATAYGTSESDQKEFGRAVQNLYDYAVDINIENSTCNQFFQNYSRSLGFS